MFSALQASRSNSLVAHPPHWFDCFSSTPTLKNVIALLGVALIGVLGACVAEAEETIDFRSQVRPILADRCFHCHGPDAQNQDSEFRLDSQENMLADLGGYAGVVPGDLKASALHERIHSTDESDQMPPPDSNRSLSEEEIRILDLWIEQGAPYQGHWSFDLPERTELPTEALQKSKWSAEVINRWSNNPIDVFIAKKLLDNELAPSPQADPSTRLRRASLTLTGLLPPRAIRDRFLADPSEQGFVDAVNALLASMSYAERQTLRWLDAARYADTDGYQVDYERTNWPWRDWVINAFHQNMPFDQFTIEQLAGDMLPNANRSQRLATAFNRNHRQNAEAGALAEEFKTENAIDRVETTSTVWLGLTMGCARCHDHKYDPLSQKEFYQLYGYFSNIGERGIGRGHNSNPLFKTVSPLKKVDLQWITAVEKQEQVVNQLEKGVRNRKEKWATKIHKQLNAPNQEDDAWTVAEVRGAKLNGAGQLTVADDGTVAYSPQDRKALDVNYEINFGSKTPIKVSQVMIEALPDDGLGVPRKLAPSNNGNFVLTDLVLSIGGTPIPIERISASFEQPGYPVLNAIDEDSQTGWGVFGPGVEPVHAIAHFESPIVLSEDMVVSAVMRFGTRYHNHSIGKLRLKFPSPELANVDQQHAEEKIENQPTVDIPAAIRTTLTKPLKKRNKKEKDAVLNYYKQIDEPYAAAVKELNQAKQELSKRAGPRVPVMVMREREGTPSPFYVLDRGQYDKPIKEEPLSRGVPRALLPSDTYQSPGNRLELARWLVSRDNPLTARVIVNRMWQDHFGVGLVKTSEDFGLQGEIPSHPELLDWLAVEFIESGWDVQAMHRLMVTSAAYGQSSVHSEKLDELDPENRLIGRGPRYRADGFVIRDIALQAAQLLNEKVGGASVKPYQPDGLWEAMANNVGVKYKPDSGEKLYRKSMYTYWKRAVNPPRQIIFDAGGREICNVSVRRTNTPLQALVLMNDPTFMESARRLAQRTLQSDATTANQRVTLMYRWANANEPSDATLEVLLGSLDYFKTRFRDDTEAAEKLLQTGSSSRDTSIDVSELAAFTSVAHLILNTDEFVSIE